ncbi:UTP--glucose-1-phosphate uridylyltransferase [Aerococcus sp. 1KP-2016]|uniref:UTP--glucose-1-phosphate uridylyltransferase n=1 Tax=Aerococcus sp. 1KP-2016 TaxID=1981982 RepID=UPI000B993F68|nr:UTP--glucose-1-phosphate uridylyltransferase [Aerococcus sp. 1KP-2016]OYQ66418.1 UTP--glucose-1-phosphate uridylyltransferase [Aerococcus sp. 1KP-2016]
MAKQRITKAVIPAGGLGTRFLPATKAMAKEIIPILDKPSIQFIVEEALASGIEEILIITGRNKRSVEDHFDANFDLEENLMAKHKDKLLKLVQDTSLLNIQFKRQHYPNGLGDGVYQAKSFVGDEPFLLLLGDDIMVNEDGKAPLSKQMIDFYETQLTDGDVLIAGAKVSPKEASAYGIMTTSDNGKDGIYTIEKLEEKPQNETEEKLAACGRYILTPAIFDAIEATKENEFSGEIELTDAIHQLNNGSNLKAFDYKGEWYEVGEPLGMLKASIQFALGHEETADGFHDYLKNTIIPSLKD